MAGLIDEEAMAKWYGHAMIEDVSTAIQETFNRKIEKSKIAAQEQQLAAEQAVEAQASEIDRQEEMAAAAADVERQHEVENLSIKGQQGIDKLALRENLRRSAP
jgi:hemoglobin-like flavoprotein